MPSDDEKIDQDIRSIINESGGESDGVFESPKVNKIRIKKKWHKRWWGRGILIFLTFFLIILIAAGIYVVRVVNLLKNNQITPQQLFGQDFTNPNLRQIVTYATEDDPSYGPKDSRLTIVEFADFQCPSCGRTSEVVKKVLADYGDRIRFVYRDFPLVDVHPQALLGAMAGECAHEQGKFWEMHDKIFENQEEITEEKVKTYAIQIGLNSVEFGTCLQTNKYLKEIEQDLSDGIKAGVEATPTFFINGIKLPGAIPFDVFQKIIVSELSR